MLAISLEPFRALDSVDFVFCSCQNFHSTESIRIHFMKVTRIITEILYSVSFWEKKEKNVTCEMNQD